MSCDEFWIMESETCATFIWDYYLEGSGFGLYVWPLVDEMASGVVENFGEFLQVSCMRPHMLFWYFKITDDVLET